MHSTVKRLLKESRVPEEPPLRVPPGPKQLAELEALKEELEEESSSSELMKWNKRDVLRIEPIVPESHERSYYAYRYSVHVSFADDELRIGPAYGEETIPCSGIDQIKRTLTALRDRLTDEGRRAQKSEKLRKLKERAIETQIEALARRHNFAYAIETMNVKIKLFIELDEKESLAVDIPHNRFQAVLAELPGLIEAVRDVHARGFRYSITQRDRFHAYRRPGPA
jgi:hypothetical protein